MWFRKPKKAVTGRYNGRQNTSIIPGFGVLHSGSTDVQPSLYIHIYMHAHLHNTCTHIHRGTLPNRIKQVRVSTYPYIYSHIHILSAYEIGTLPNRIKQARLSTYSYTCIHILSAYETGKVPNRIKPARLSSHQNDSPHRSGLT
jgi:hypothetical protein